MKSYVIVVGLLALVHLWRIVEEPHLARDPWFILVTLIAAALSLGAWRVLRRSNPP